MRLVLRESQDRPKLDVESTLTTRGRRLSIDASSYVTVEQGLPEDFLLARAMQTAVREVPSYPQKTVKGEGFPLLPSTPTPPDASPSRELAQALAVMRATLEAATDGILVTDETGRAQDCNEMFLKLWNLDRSFLVSAPIDEIREVESRRFANPKRFLDRIDAITASRHESFDLLELKGGRMLERYSKVLFVEGASVGRVWSFRDVTERHQAELTSRRLAAIVASSDDAIIGKDLDSIITSWNFGAERIFGYAAEEMIGTSIMRLIPADRQNEETEILSRIRSGERLDHFETIRVAKDGSLLHVSITVSPIKDPLNHVVGASKVARDITEKKNWEQALTKAMADAELANREKEQLLESEREARAQAERTSRMKDEFLATLSHELRTPLNAILGWASVLKHGTLNESEVKQGVETIERNARVQAQIIEDLLDMSRIISGKVRLEVQPIELFALVGQSLHTVQATAAAKGVNLEVKMKEAPGPMFGDPGRLQQVFWNLLNNAIKFTDTGGSVEVVCGRKGAQAEVCVVDSGEGIAADFLPYVFDRFQQADASTTRRHGGLGLGLAIVKQLVELHGGRVHVHSEGPGKGSTFIVTLPLQAVYPEQENERRNPRAEMPERRPMPDISLQDVKVLVVDDEPDSRELVKRLLELVGASVTMAASAAEAMDSIQRERPDVLVCDIGMPGEDGYSLIRRLREGEGDVEEGLPAIALTAYARAEDRTKAIRSGFQNHLAKPVEPSELLAVVNSLAGR